MADTLVLRLDIETGMYANFLENFKPYTDVKAVVGIGDFEPETDKVDQRPVFRTHEGVVVTSSGVGLSDSYAVQPIETGMYVDNVADTDGITTAVEGLFRGRVGQMHHVERATFVGEEAIADAIEALDCSEHHDAVLASQLAILGINYARREVRDTVSTSRY